MSHVDYGAENSLKSYVTRSESSNSTTCTQHTQLTYLTRTIIKSSKYLCIRTCTKNSRNSLMNKFRVLNFLSNAFIYIRLILP